MTRDESDVFVNNLNNYCVHLAENEDSLISKIYGVFTFNFSDKTEYILIMRNI